MRPYRLYGRTFLWQTLTLYPIVTVSLATFGLHKGKKAAEQNANQLFLQGYQAKVVWHYISLTLILFRSSVYKIMYGHVKIGEIWHISNGQTGGAPNEI